jgi:predicted esterase
MTSRNLFMKKLLLPFLVFISFPVDLFSQQVYQFTKGLMARTGYRYGREALYTDPLAFRLYMNTLTTPVEGAAFGKNENGETVNWQPVVADSLLRLRGPGGQGFGGRGAGSYIYLTYQSDKEQGALLNIKGNSGVYINGVPHMGDAYSSGFLYIPVKLKKGLNEFYVRGAFVIASLVFPTKPVSLNTEDPTLPGILLTENINTLQAAVVVINTSGSDLKGLEIKSVIEGKEVISSIPDIPSFSTRKVPFVINASGVSSKGTYTCSLTLMDNRKQLDEGKISLDAVDVSSKFSSTFISDIDGSLQYYAVAPQISYKPGGALFLSVHGAGVEAIGQARAYQSKDWGTLVAATNRRPRGFNWEDWGRLDALEVFERAKQRFKPDPQQIYLTGHSMGGHGTWFLGATYPDKWAAIAPCAGYPTLKGYGSADGLIPDSSNIPVEQMLIRASNQSDVIKLATNYKPLGVYVFHGDADRTVSVNYARQMKKLLADFHADLSYYEYPGGEHWFGDQSVDWRPIFDFFKWHKLAPDSAVNTIDFSTASPGISSTFRWASIQQQVQPLVYSRIQINRNRTSRTITGSTTNVRLLKLNLKDFGSGTAVTITLDQLEPVRYTTRNANDSLLLLKENGRWIPSSNPDPFQKGPHRYGTFKDAFNHHMVFVYGTTGSKEENEWSLNKARYDAETWYYRGNGAVDIISDKAFSLEKYKDRGVIIFGNKNTNAAWKQLLTDCPIQVEKNRLNVGDKVWNGDDLAAYFVWPIRSSAIASVGVVTGTGIKGMKAAYANQYFAGASGFPDFMVYGLNMLNSGAPEVKIAGFFNQDWRLEEGNYVEGAR